MEPMNRRSLFRKGLMFGAIAALAPVDRALAKVAPEKELPKLDGVTINGDVHLTGSGPVTITNSSIQSHKAGPAVHIKPIYNQGKAPDVVPIRFASPEKR